MVFWLIPDAGKLKNNPGTSCVRNLKSAGNRMQMSKGHLNQPEGLVAKAGRLSETLFKMIILWIKRVSLVAQMVKNLLAM